MKCCSDTWRHNIANGCTRWPGIDRASAKPLLFSLDFVAVGDDDNDARLLEECLANLIQIKSFLLVYGAVKTTINDQI